MSKPTEHPKRLAKFEIYVDVDEVKSIDDKCDVCDFSNDVHANFVIIEDAKSTRLEGNFCRRHMLAEIDKIHRQMIDRAMKLTSIARNKRRDTLNPRNQVKSKVNDKPEEKKK